MRAAGGDALLEGAANGIATVVGRVGAPRAVDRQGWAAPLHVEQVLDGDLVPGAEVRVAWEELARQRAVRFAKGERILVALEPLPGMTLWRQRFPDGAGYAVAGRGDAFLRDPDPASVAELAAFVALPEAERTAREGVAALAGLAARAHPALARAALARLETIPGLDARLGPSARSDLARVLGSGDLELARAGLALVERRRLASLRPRVEPLTAEGSPVRGEALAALVSLDGGMPEERVAALIRSSDPGARAVAAGQAGGTPSEGILPGLVASDPSPQVRLAAARTLLRSRGDAALPDVAPALFDADPEVRALAAAEIGRLGAASVAFLDELARERSGQEAAGPLMGLSLAGPWGRDALLRIADEHGDEQVRRMAIFFLGRDPGHGH